jgi:hypothetical protein
MAGVNVTGVTLPASGDGGDDGSKIGQQLVRRGVAM